MAIKPICVLIFGPPAVGKMTVGIELANLTGLKLFHNHMTIELLIRIFPHGSPEFKQLDKEFRFRIFDEMAKSDQKGIIFTYVFALDDEDDWRYTYEIMDVFEKNGGKVFFVELFATQETRLKRNTTSIRLDEKPSKRDLKFSETGLRNMDKKYKLNSIDKEINIMQTKLGKYIKVDNEDLNADIVAKMIIKEFSLHSEK